MLACLLTCTMYACMRPHTCAHANTLTHTQVSSKEEAFSRTLHTSCVNPELQICMIRGLSSAMDLDLEKFSSESLVQTCPDHEMEVRVQVCVCVCVCMHAYV